VQRESIDALNTRAGLILGLSALILTSFMSSWQFDIQCVWFGYLLLISTFGTALFSLFGYMVKSYRVDPEPRPLVKDYLEKPESLTKKQILDNWIESYEKNRHTIGEKAFLVKAAIWSLMAFIVLATIYVLI